MKLYEKKGMIRTPMHVIDLVYRLLDAEYLFEVADYVLENYENGEYEEED